MRLERLNQWGADRLRGKTLCENFADQHPRCVAVGIVEVDATLPIYAKTEAVGILKFSA